MSAWLSSRLKNDPAVKRDLFATKELTVQALKSAVRRHGDKHCATKDVWVGSRLRHEVEVGDGFVAVYWVSVEPDSSEPISPTFVGPPDLSMCMWAESTNSWTRRR